MKPIHDLFAFALLVFIFASMVMAQDRTMIGRQSQNEGMLVVPVPGNVVIDGKLDDWDLSGRIWMFADRDVRSRYSGQVSAMWSADALYLAVRWFDPTPMFSNVDPDTDPQEGWRSDSVQMRVRTGDQVMWLTTWYYTPKAQPVMGLAVWKDPQNQRAGTVNSLLKAEPGKSDLGRGVEMAYRPTEDGTGYVQEMKIPWAVLYQNPPKVGVGTTIQIGFELLWGDPTGKAVPIHRYADNVQPGKTTREFFWTAKDVWGDLKLVGSGNVPERKYIDNSSQIQGTVGVRVTIPRSASKATIAINDSTGTRVRNLAADVATDDYTVATSDSTRTVEVKWDLLNDSGAMVSAGEYQVVGLSHKGLGAEYEMCFYNPGTPPWETKDSRGGWGADHTPPLRVARTGAGVALSWAFAEGGSGIISVGPDGRKMWGEKRGGVQLAGDKDSIYAVAAGWHIKEQTLIRLGAVKGDYRPFVKAGVERPFELSIASIIGDDGWRISGVAAGKDHLVLLLSRKPANSNAASSSAGDEAETEITGSDGESRIVWLDKSSAEVVRSIQCEAMNGLAMAADGTVYSFNSSGVHRISVGKSSLQAIPAEGLGKPVAIAVDDGGNLVAVDGGPDQQVKAFDRHGKVVYTCGRKGGRPIRGDFDPQAMSHMSSVAVDAQGQVWVVENWEFPRRVSVWNPKDGTLVREYIGNTGYAGTGCWLHDQNPELAYVGPVELSLDKKNRTWKVSKILWVPDTTRGESFTIDSREHVLTQRFTANVRGTPHEYLLASPFRDHFGHVLLMERADGWKPVCAITTVGRLFDSFGAKGEVITPPSGEFSDCNAYDAIVWNDMNKDGIVQRSECEVVKTTKPGTASKRGEPGLPMGSGWGQRMTPDLSFYVNGVYRYTPISYTDDGAPIFSTRSLSQKLFDERGEILGVPGENRILVMGSRGYPRAAKLFGIDATSGAVQWTYPNPFPGVHGSHNATMAEPGLLIGPLRICGIAKINEEVGNLFVMRGNLGQDFLMTTDGLYVGAMFQDGRLPCETLPDREQDLIGRPMEIYSHGAEAFNGWFGKQADGVVRMTTGFPRQGAMILSVNGLDQVKRFGATSIRIGPDELAAADRDNLARVRATAAEKIYKIARWDAAASGNANTDRWAGKAEMLIDRPGFPFAGKVKLAYDDSNLYVRYEIEDPSPWRNEGKEFTRLFKTGDAVDLQIGPALGAGETKNQKIDAGHVRIVMAQVGGKPVGVLMKPIDPTANAERAVSYQSPVGTRKYDRVELIKEIVIKVRTGDQGYVVEGTIPLVLLGIKPVKGLSIRGDLGFISSDAQGTMNVARTYWSNKDTNLVSDLPEESWMQPQSWGTLVFD